MGEIALWRTAEGSWAWRYRAPGEPDVTANRTFETRDGAVASARRAYPGVPVRWQRPRARRMSRAPLLAAGVAVAVLVALRRPRAVAVRRVRDRAGRLGRLGRGG